MLVRSTIQLVGRPAGLTQKASFSSHPVLLRYGPRAVIVRQPDFRTATEKTADGLPWRQPASTQFYGTLFRETSSRQAGPKQPEETNEQPRATQPEKPSGESKAAQPDPARDEPLPDLRFGIPTEMPGQARSADRADGQAKPQPESESQSSQSEQTSGSGGSGRNGEFPDSAYQTSTDRKRNVLAKYSLVTVGLALTLFGLYLGRGWDSEAQEKANPDAPPGWSIGHFWARLRARLSSKVDYYTEPTFPKLLPDQDRNICPPSGMTLVLSLEDLMVHSNWTREHGWQTAKRPGLDYFLRYLSQYYELVLFTSVPMMSAEPILARLDPYRIITWPLFREATRYDEGDYVKDLTYLNRDLSKVIVLDTDAKHVKFQPENSIVIAPWKGTPGDKNLISLIPFLEYVAAMEVPDVRTVLKSFDGVDIPTEFSRREAAKREELRQQAEADAAAHKSKNGGFAWFAAALGMKPITATGEPSIADGLSEGALLSDVIRERGMRNYEFLEKQIREQGEQWLKELEAEQKRMQDEQVKSMKSTFMGTLFGLGKSDSTESKDAKKPESTAEGSKEPASKPTGEAAAAAPDSKAVPPASS